MKIEHFSFEYKLLNLKINPIQFSSLSLLIGVSGVGKTLILRSLLNLKEIAQGESFNGLKWELSFFTTSHEHYAWEGEFETVDSFLDEASFVGKDKNQDNKNITPNPKIQFEALHRNGTLIAEREGNEISFNNQLTPKLSSHQSLLALFSEEDLVKSAFKNVQKMIASDEFDPYGIYFSDGFEELLQSDITPTSIKKMSIPNNIKLALAYNNNLSLFTTIKNHFITIFPQVEDLTFKKISALKQNHVPMLHIKEKNVDQWITQLRISSGMFKTLILLSQLFLCEAGSVILIDEFENSLGFNCINTLVENLLDDEHDLQFIITSHHPYIINAIGMDHWKIVSRHGGIITTQEAKDFKLGRSRHEAFKQLIQLTQFKQGIII